MIYTIGHTEIYNEAFKNKERLGSRPMKKRKTLKLYWRFSLENIWKSEEICIKK